jgi:CubicO group peptidase (beta-lactamase class C family)
MHKKYPILILIPMLLLSFILVPGCPALARAAGENPCQQLDTYLEAQIKSFNLPGAAVLVVEDNQVVHSRGFGSAGHDPDIPAAQTPFFIGSLTKSLTALAVMQLVEAEAVRLDAPVQEYLPWFRLAESRSSAGRTPDDRTPGDRTMGQITIRQLLYQTSGIPQIPGMLGLVNFDSSPDAVEQQARALGGLSLSRPPGTAWEYSNVNYNLLGLVIEAASGQSYQAYIQEHIFNPLKMGHSFTAKADAREHGLTVGHQQWFGFPVPVPHQPIPTGSLPSGQLVSSPADLGRYMIALLNDGDFMGERILSAEGIAALLQPGARIDMIGMEEESYGMGWFVRNTAQGPLIWHYGEVPDYYAYMALQPDQNRGIVLLVNTNQHFYTYAMTEIGHAAVNILSGATPEANPWRVLPWALRGLVLLPILQVVLIFTAICRLKKAPGRKRGWAYHLFLVILPNLLLMVIPAGLLASGMFRFSMQFMGDITLIFTLTGLIAMIWLAVRYIPGAGIKARRRA